MRALMWFWTVVLVILAGGAGTLQVLGPPDQGGNKTVVATAEPPKSAPAVTEAPPAPKTIAAASPMTSPPPPLVPGRISAGPIASPDPALMDVMDSNAPQRLPRIATDGRTPMQVYAKGFDPSDRRPRIGLLLSGVGLNEADSEDAIRQLPGEISLAISPYAAKPDLLLQTARSLGHEFLISIPMEPEGYPLNDAGNQALLTGNTPAENRDRLMWALSRIAGYVGATGALDGMRGERFAASTDQMVLVEEQMAARGLLYVDPRPATTDTLPDQPMPMWNRRVDVVVDEPALRAEVEAKLASLEHIAHDKGSALGLAGLIRPSTLEAIIAWSNGLAARGFALAPVSKLMIAPMTEQASR